MFSVKNIKNVSRSGEYFIVTLNDNTNYTVKPVYFGFDFIGRCPNDLENIDQKTINFLSELYFKKC